MTSETALVNTVVGTGTDIALSPPLDRVREFIRASKAENTLRGYQSDWRDFCAWCESRGLGPLPAAPEVVASYIAECAGHLKVGAFNGDRTPLRRRTRRWGWNHPRTALLWPTP